MKATLWMLWVLAVVSLVSCTGPRAGSADARAGLENVRQILVLGDSITYSGQYVEDLEAWCATRLPDRKIEFINVGLPSEVVSGLSEPDHAGGQFLRPDLHERLDRILAKTKPDLVLVCYGMNDGIYLPFDEARFRPFREGIEWVHAKLAPTGARILHLTPPPFDESKGGHPGYADTLRHYSQWLLDQRAKGWEVVDLNGPMTRYQEARQTTDPKFVLAGDGVHPGDLGHWLMAREILRHWGASDVAGMEGVAAMMAARPNGDEVLKLIQKKQRMLKDAWLSETGHRRPGMNRGLPLPEAKVEAAKLDRRIAVLSAPGKSPLAPAAFAP
jgi:lysophospholipase L1-like esterase